MAIQPAPQQGMTHLRGRAGDDKIAGDAAPVPLAILGQAHEEEAVLLLSPGDALPPLRVLALHLLLQLGHRQGLPWDGVVGQLHPAQVDGFEVVLQWGKWRRGGGGVGDGWLWVNGWV